ncbi:MAG: TlpA family protein disulfide reductase, partial [Planctomycetes bacterium]|nr:TlpA family protein disulfide reductase [Planctomycetota bacterium]
VAFVLLLGVVWMKHRGLHNAARYYNKNIAHFSKPEQDAARMLVRPQDLLNANQFTHFVLVAMMGVLVPVVVIVGLLAFAIFQGIRESGSGGNFEISLYQGADTLGASELKFEDVLSLGKPVVLNFWAGDCPPCRAEMPAFQRVYERQQDDVIFLGLDVGVFTGLGTRESALRLLNELGITYPAGAPPSRTSVVRYSVVSMPTTVFFDASGQILDRIDGAMSEFRLATEDERELAAAFKVWSNELKGLSKLVTRIRVGSQERECHPLNGRKLANGRGNGTATSVLASQQQTATTETGHGEDGQRS